MKTWTKYRVFHFIISSIACYGAASPLVLGQAHVIFAGIKSANFQSPYWRGKGLLGFGSATICMAGRNSTFSSFKYPHSRHVQTRILIRLKVSHCCNSRVLLLRPTPRTRPTIRNPTFSIKLSSFIRNILIAILVLTCSRFQVGIKTLVGQADRAPARSVTPGDCPSDCIGARALHVQSDRQARTSPTNRSIHVSSKDRPPLPYQVVSDFRLLGEILLFSQCRLHLPSYP